MLDCQMFGLWAGGHHLVSLVLHAASTLVLFLTFRRLTGATWRSVAIALLFALHPLHVESVAWISERKDVLSAFFWMLCVLMYVCYAQEPKITSPPSARQKAHLLSRFPFLHLRPDEQDDGSHVAVDPVAAGLVAPPSFPGLDPQPPNLQPASRKTTFPCGRIGL
jgi:hypothetical protein